MVQKTPESLSVPGFFYRFALHPLILGEKGETGTEIGPFGLPLSEARSSWPGTNIQEGELKHEIDLCTSDCR